MFALVVAVVCALLHLTSSSLLTEKTGGHRDEGTPAEHQAHILEGHENNEEYLEIHDARVSGGSYKIRHPRTYSPYYTKPEAEAEAETVADGGRKRKLNGFVKPKLDDLYAAGVVESYPPERDPAPFTANNRVLGMVLMFNFAHIDPFMLALLPEYVSMCEGGWDPRVVIFTASYWSPRTRRLFLEKSYCYRTGKNINIEWAVYDKKVGFALAAVHRQYMGNHLEEFDMFLYHEDDIPFRFSHVNAYAIEVALLKERLPWTGLFNYMIGWQRYRHEGRQGERSAEQWNEIDLLEQTLLEEVPRFSTECLTGEDPNINPFLHPRKINFDKPVPYTWDNQDGDLPVHKEAGSVYGTGTTTRSRSRSRSRKARRNLRSVKDAKDSIGGSDDTDAPGKVNRKLSVGDWDNLKVYPYINVLGNIHQGAFMLTQEQVKLMQLKCQFLNQTSPSREYMSSFSIFDGGAGHCDYRKILPAERFQSFLVHHVYHTKFVSWFTAGLTDDKTRTGREYLSDNQNTNHGCWAPIIAKNVASLAIEAAIPKKNNNTYQLPFNAFTHEQQETALKITSEQILAVAGGW